MLIKGYELKLAQSPNHGGLCEGCSECEAARFSGTPYRTTDMTVFDSFTTETLRDLMEGQYALAKAEADAQLKYGSVSKNSYERTLEQYAKLFFFEGHSYLKGSLIAKVVADQNAQSAIVNDPSSFTETRTPFSDVHPSEEYDDSVVFVSREAIRAITGFTVRPVPKWSATGEPVYLKWQEDLLEDDSEYIVVDGSRQIGKSNTISEKLVEESWIPDNDTLVCAFVAKTTDVIRNYFKKHVRKFEEGTFEENKKEGFIINTKTLTKIYFRTASDDSADAIRGLTLKRIVVDEAQLVSDSVYDEILEPTMSTTGGQMILIGTAGRKRAGFMYDKMMEIQKGEIEGSYYKVSANENPLLHPKKRAKIMANKDKPSIRREYFNEWGEVGDELFSIQRCSELPPMDMEEDVFVLGLDPARKRDRSGNALVHVANGVATIVLSGFVPDSHKDEWKKQAEHYRRMIGSYMKTHPHYRANTNEHPTDRWYDVMDVTGVGDGVEEIFRSNGVRVHGKVRYTSGLSETDEGTTFKVGKTVLINTFLDLCQEGLIQVYEPTNKYLLEEMSHIEEGKSTAGSVTMKTSFFDDVTNAAMIAAYFIVKRRLLGRAKSRTEKPDEPFVPNPHVDAIERTRSPFRKRDASSVW